MGLVIDMASSFAGMINVGGIQYTFDPSKVGINYLFRSYRDFEKTFQPVAERSTIPLPKIKSLFIKYFRVEPFVEHDFGIIDIKDKRDLIKIFDAYLKYLENSKSMSGDSVASIMLNITYYNISDILMGLRGAPKDFSKMSVTCQESKKALLDLDPVRKERMILEFTWLLNHPKKIGSKDACTWADAISGLKDIPLSEATNQVKQNNVAQNSEIDNGDMNEVQQGGGNDAIPARMKSLLMVSYILDTAKKSGCDENDESYCHLQQSFSTAVLSLFDEIKSLYQPVYSVIENCMKHVKKNKIIMPLLQLQHISNHFIESRKDAYGIYRIKNPKKRLVSYLTSQLHCISSKVGKMKPSQQRQYHDVQKELTPILPETLPKRKAVASSKKDVVLPIVQFVTLDGNLTIPPFEQFYRKGSESEKEQFFKVMTDFFTKDNIYMIYSNTDEVPLKFYDIHFPSIDTTDSYIPVTDYDSKRIVENHVLQDFCTLIPHATYTNAELVLSIFISLKEKRTK